MIEDILCKTVAESQTAKQFHDFNLHRRQAQLENRFLARPDNRFVDLLGDFRNDFFDSCGMDPSVQNQTLHRLARDLPSHRIKSGEHDRIWRVIDEHCDSGYGLKGANVSTFAANDAAFNIFALERHRSGRSLESVGASVPLDCQTDYSARLLLGFCLGVINNVARKLGGRTLIFLFDLLEKGGASIVFAELRNSLELLLAQLNELLKLLLGCLQIRLPGFQPLMLRS